jgi:hypothetical protein
MAIPAPPDPTAPRRDDRASGGAGVELHAADLAQARLLQLRASKLVANAVSGAYRSSFLGSGIEFEEVRPYQPGDDVRTIDWKVTARTREPHIKTYREERQLRVFCVVDVAPGMDFGSRDVGERRRRSDGEERYGRRKGDAAPFWSCSEPNRCCTWIPKPVATSPCASTAKCSARGRPDPAGAEWGAPWITWPVACGATRCCS